MPGQWLRVFPHNIHQPTIPKEEVEWRADRQLHRQAVSVLLTDWFPSPFVPCLSVRVSGESYMYSTPPDLTFHSCKCGRQNPDVW